jgi:predicted ATPase
LLLRRWQQVANGNGQVVLLLGEPGIGKSRLALAARRTIVDSRHFRVILQCSSLHADTALHPIVAEIGRVIGLRPRQPEDIPRRRLWRLLSALMPESGHSVPLFARLLGLSEATGRDLDGLRPEVLKEQTLAALLDLVERLSERRLTLIVVEDAQWIDPTSRELLDLLCERLSRLRVLLLVTARSGFAPAWLPADNCTSLTLRRLAKRDGVTMVRQLCGARSLPPEDVERITIVAEGVPLFIEELGRAVLEARASEASGNGPGTAKLDIPATLSGLLTARLDQLGAAKEVVQVGSAIGRSFSVDLARQAAAADEALVEDALHRLVDLGLATIRGRSRQRVCTFRHVLIQEAAYQSMLRSLRRSVHRRIAKLFEEAGRSAHRVSPEILAHHYAEAGDTAGAVSKYHEAGRLAATRSANVEAGHLLGRALQLLRSLPPAPERDEQELSLLVSLGPVITTTSGPGALDVVALYERAVALCGGLRQSPSQFPAYWGWWHSSPNFKVMRERAETLAALARTLRDEQLLLQAHHCQWATLFNLGEQEACCAHIAEGLELYERGDYRAHGTLYGGHDPKGCALGEKALSLWLQGFPDPSLKAAEQCLEHTAQLRHAGSVAHAKDQEIMVRRYRREAELVLERARSMRAFAGEHRFRDLGAKADIFEGWALAALGRPRAGLEMIESGLATQREIGTQEDFPVYYEMLAEAYGLVAQPERGLTLVEEAMEMAQETGLQYWTAELLRRKGNLLFQGGETRSALSCFDAAGAIAQTQRARSSFALPQARPASWRALGSGRSLSSASTLSTPRSLAASKPGTCRTLGSSSRSSVDRDGEAVPSWHAQEPRAGGDPRAGQAADGPPRDHAFVERDGPRPRRHPGRHRLSA